MKGEVRVRISPFMVQRSVVFQAFNLTHLSLFLLGKSKRERQEYKDEDNVCIPGMR